MQELEDLVIKADIPLQKTLGNKQKFPLVFRAKRADTTFPQLQEWVKKNQKKLTQLTQEYVRNNKFTSLL